MAKEVSFPKYVLSIYDIYIQYFVEEVEMERNVRSLKFTLNRCEY